MIHDNHFVVFKFHLSTAVGGGYLISLRLRSAAAPRVSFALVAAAHNSQGTS